MKFDVFFSICQTPVDGHMPNERRMFENFFDQLQLADELGFGTGWVAETHLSCQIQKRTSDAVVPYFEGEIGLNTDILQLAHVAFARTRRINMGSAIRNIQCNGGPLAHAEAVRTFLTLNSLGPFSHRRLELGFAAGRFQFSNTPYGIVPRSPTEKAAWPVVKTKILQEATEIFLRALRGDVIASRDIAPKEMVRADFRSDRDWEAAQKAYAAEREIRGSIDSIPLAPNWVFEEVGVIPTEAPLENLTLTIGTHDAQTQTLANRFLPCGVFNLSITPAWVIEATHSRMEKAFHPKGGPWRRWHMPRTALVFINGSPSLSSHAQSDTARASAVKANEIYWRAMEGTLDPTKVAQAVDNALVGNPEEIVEQIRARYHPDDRLMLWFDFNNHDSEAVKAAMCTFVDRVLPHLPTSPPNN